MSIGSIAPGLRRFVICISRQYPSTFGLFGNIQTRDDYEQFVARYGVRRSNENFCDHADWFHNQYAHEKTVLSGLFDLNRYRYRYRNRYRNR
jgi:hypothetical protein